MGQPNILMSAQAAPSFSQVLAGKRIDVCKQSKYFILDSTRLGLESNRNPQKKENNGNFSEASLQFTIEYSHKKLKASTKIFWAKNMEIKFGRK